MTTKTTMHNRAIAVIIGGLAMLTLCACLPLAAVTACGVASWAAGFYGLTQYAQSTNAYIENTESTCEKKRPARRGRSHNQPEWTGY